MALQQILSDIKQLTLRIEQKIVTSPPARFLQRRADEVTTAIHNLPPVVTAAMNIIPVVNILIFHSKEKHFRQDAVELTDYNISKIKLESAQAEKKALTSQTQSLTAHLTQLQRKKAALDAEPQDASVITKAKNKLASINCNDKTIEKAQLELDKALTKLEEKQAEENNATAEHANCERAMDNPDAQARISAVNKGRKINKGTFFIGLTATVIAAIAISIFSVGAGFALFLVAGLTFGYYITIMNIDKLKFQGDKQLNTPPD